MEAKLLKRKSRAPGKGAMADRLAIELLRVAPLEIFNLF